MARTLRSTMTEFWDKTESNFSPVKAERLDGNEAEWGLGKEGAQNSSEVVKEDSDEFDDEDGDDSSLEFDDHMKMKESESRLLSGAQIDEFVLSCCDTEGEKKAFEEEIKSFNEEMSRIQLERERIRWTRQYFKRLAEKQWLKKPSLKVSSKLKIKKLHKVLRKKITRVYYPWRYNSKYADFYCELQKKLDFCINHPYDTKEYFKSLVDEKVKELEELKKKLDSGVKDFSLDLGTAKVAVTSSLPADSLKTGKEVTYVGAK